MRKRIPYSLADLGTMNTPSGLDLNYASLVFEGMSGKVTGNALVTEYNPEAKLLSTVAGAATPHYINHTVEVTFSLEQEDSDVAAAVVTFDDPVANVPFEIAYEGDPDGEHDISASITVWPLLHFDV